MKLLAIDCATDACSAALYIDKQFFDRFEVAPKQHSKLILPMVDSLLQQANIKLSELDAFAFGCGPGSFTGLRIATSIVQGFGFATQKPIIPVSTLRALAQEAYQTLQAKEVFAWLDARLQEIYWGLFVLGDDEIMQSASSESVQTRESIHLPEDKWLEFTGYPSALNIARIAVAEYQLGHVVSAMEVQPVYIRNNVIK